MVSRFEFSLNAEQQYVQTKYFGEVCMSDIEEAVTQGNALYPNLDSLVDFSEASLKELSAQDVRQLVRLATEHEPQGINCAFVAPENLEFGLSRMYATMADADLPQNRAIFRSLPEARAWLTEQRDIHTDR